MTARTTGAPMQGAAVELARDLAAGADAAPKFTVLAYEATLEARRGFKLTRALFEQCVRNHERYGKRTPVTLFHADTDPAAHPEARKAVGRVAEMRIGEMTRANGRRVATLEGQLVLNEPTRRAVLSEPPELAFGSITVYPDAIDEESGEPIGGLIWSFTLTNNPALTELPRIQLETQPGDTDMPTKDEGAAEATRPQAPVFLTLAARLGVQAESDDEARDKVYALARETTDVRRALGTASLAETAERLTALRADAAKVPALEKDVAALRAQVETRDATERASYIADVMLARGFDEDMRETLELHAKSNWEGFQKKFPRASKQELAQRRQDAARLERLTARGANPEARARAGVTDEARGVGEDLSRAATLLVEQAREEGRSMTFSEALELVMDPAFDVADEDTEPADRSPAVEPADD
jgi:hypothetical protein